MAQVSFDSPEELEKAANEFFDQSDYGKAKPLFSQLLSKDAMNPNYNYRFGVCILFTEADPLKPLPYIEGGANSNGVNVEAHYFLGKALQFNYRFDDAIASYQKAKAGGLNKPNIDLDRSIEECRNGKILYNPAIDFQPAQNKEVLASEFYRPYDFRKLKGKVIPMPPNFKTKYDQKNLTGTVIYTPTNSQTLIYASYGEDGANGKDLYRVNRLPNGELALPQRLPNAINTEYDEDYAFFDEESQVLFFASKGHNSMGGYDVFSSKYDPNTSNWSTPVNLQYPINSPYDDFLYVSDPEGKVAFFTSQRNVEAGKLRVLKTLLHNPQQVEVSVLEGTFEDQTDSLYNYAALTVLDPLTNEVVGKYRSHKVTGKYLLILPPQNDYKMDVGPREADGFKFDLDVPQQESIRPLQQEITYNSSAEKGTITVTNFFDAAGKPDSIAVAKSRSLSEIEANMVTMPDPTEILAARSQASSQKENELALAEKANKDSLKQAAQELALKEKQAAEEAAQQVALAKAQKATQDSIKQAQELALKEKQAAEEAARQAALAKAQKATQDSIKQAQELALKEKQAAEETARQAALAKAQKATQDSIKQAQELALKEKQATEEAARQAALAKAQKATQDSLNQIRQKALALQQKEVAEKAAKLKERAKAEKMRLDSILQAEQEALALRQKAAANKKAEEIRKDSIQQAEQLAAQEQKAAELKKQAKQDSLKALQELVIRKQLATAAQTEEELEKEFVAKAIEKAKQDSIQEVEAFEKLQASHVAARANRDSTEKAIELARIKEQKEKIVRDSIAAVELALKKEQEVKLDSLNKRKDLLTQIKEIELKKELAKKEDIVSVTDTTTATQEIEVATLNDLAETEQLKQDSLIQPELAKQEEQPSYDEILKEMAEIEEKILSKADSVEKETESLSLNNEVVAAKPAAVDTTTSEAVEGAQTSEESEALTETKTLSESELFLQTIAKMEAQKEEQTALVERENQTRKKVEEEQKHAIAEAKSALDTAASNSTTVANEITEANIDTTEIETISVALKSDANPAEYLAALNKIEADIAKDAADNKSKNYELRELPAVPAANAKEIEPVLQAKIDADRKALAEHQIIAAKKENALKEQMQRDKATVTSINQAAAEEINTIENEILENLESNKAIAVAETQAEVKEVATEQPLVEAEKVEETTKELVAEEVSETELKAETKEVSNSSAEKEVLDALAEFDKILNNEEDSEPNVNAEEEPTALESTKEEVVEIEATESIEEIVEATTHAQKQEEIAEVVEVEKQPTAQPKPALIASPVTETNATDANTTQEIPFMTAALRDYSKRKVSFEQIENPTMRKMIKRMKSEDVGRIAVLKNMKNEWVDAGKTAESLKEIKKNTRNQDVLETVASAPSREEFIRLPFDKNTLRKRQDVHYKLEIRISTNGLSETVSEAMSPEQAISFAMPEFDVQSGYYETFADANSDYKEFVSRGFESVKIVTYFKNEQVRLSDVAEIPFID